MLQGPINNGMGFMKIREQTIFSRSGFRILTVTMASKVGVLEFNVRTFTSV